MPDTAFVTGATGFVGANLIRALLADGWQVTALVRADSSRTDLAGLDIECREGDITDGDSLLRAVPEATDCVFHLAASTNVWTPNNALQTRINVEGTRQVIEAVRQRRARRLIHCSSFVAWGFQDGVFDETTPRSDNGHWINYLRTKAAAEALVRDAAADDVDAVIVNPGHILGPYDRSNWSRLIRLVAEEKLPGIPPGGGAFADVREIARAMIRAVSDGRRGENYLLGGVSASYVEFVGLVGQTLGREVPQRSTPAWVLRGYARVLDAWSRINRREPDLTPESVAMVTRHIECDSSKAQRELGYGTTPLPQLVRDTCEWLESAGLLPDDVSLHG